MPDRTCPQCATEFAATGPRVYCSNRCKEAAKYERIRNDPEKWSEELARCRARYVPKPPRPIRLCDEPGCAGKHLARGLCSKHYRRWQWEQGNEARNPTTVVGAMASLFGAYFPKPKMIKVRATVGVMAHCPWCDSLMAATSPAGRACRACGTTAVLNEEEVSWVISEARLTRA